MGQPAGGPGDCHGQQPPLKVTGPSPNLEPSPVRKRPPAPGSWTAVTVWGPGAGDLGRAWGPGPGLVGRAECACEPV